MSPLTITLKKQPDSDLDVSVLVPEKLAGKSGKQVLEIPIGPGKDRLSIGDFFKVTGSDSEHIRLLGSCNRLVHVGHAMKRGYMEVTGDVGDFLGEGMSGGLIRVNGNAGHWTGAGMLGGKIEITGNTGHYLGAASKGKAHGMNNGTVIVHGNSGNRTGERMRRGLIVVLGNAGEYCANQMLAGTLIIVGKTGAYLGFGMKRGTIVLARKPGQLLATFNSCGLLKIEFLRLLFKQLALSCDTLTRFAQFGPEATRYAGDSAIAGKGEILVLHNARKPK